jgi:Icc protein
LHLIQFTDLHLYSRPGGRLLGQDTKATLDLVLAAARTRHWPPDAVLLTGDLIHDERPFGYRCLRDWIDDLRVPTYCLPGNHDQPSLMAAHLEPDAAEPFRAVAIGAWDLVLLDSTVPGSDGGHLAGETLSLLRRHLGTKSQRPVLVCLHHQPLPMGSRWIDTMIVDNGAELLALAQRHARVRGILWGHVHQTFDRFLGQVRLMATPSTCVQFLPGSDAFRLDHQTPGYRWLELLPDGRIESGVERIAAYPEPLIIDGAGGY